MELVLYGNQDAYYLTKTFTPLEIRLAVKDFRNGDSIFTILYNNLPINTTHKELFNIYSQIKGAKAIDIHFILARTSFPKDFIVSFLKKNAIETALFKSLFLVYFWIDTAFTDPYAVSLSSKIYDEFIIDFDYSKTNQDDIYFIRKELITDDNQPYIDLLIKFNLLSKVEIISQNLGRYTTYFIPIIKPGIPQSFFSNSESKIGMSAYNFWKLILKDRDSRIKFWMKNRF